VGVALDRIAGRLSRGGKFMRAVTEIEANYEALEIDFLGFFPDLAAFCTEWKHRQRHVSDSIEDLTTKVTPEISSVGR
jgi:acyl carrier protein phosphodiesterase